jgi:DNA-binding response OmpR family regulator
MPPLFLCVEDTMAAPVIGIAEHDPVLLRLLNQALWEAGFQSLRFPTSWSTHDQLGTSQPDLIILDTWLENREAGWVLFKKLRLDPRTKEIPVLVCSSEHEFEMRVTRCGEDEIVGLICKPFDVNFLVNRVRQMLDGPKGQRRRGGGI